MKESNTINDNYDLRLDDVLSESWKIFKSQFIKGRYGQMLKEAPFQLHFANVIKSVGDLYCIERKEIFSVDLEYKAEKIKEKNKYVDVFCEFTKLGNDKEHLDKYSCGIELKFKTKKQSASNNGKVDAYIDIEAIELIVGRGDVDTGRFYMITNHLEYIKPSKEGTVGSIFATYDGYRNLSNKELICDNKSKKVRVKLKNEYLFSWEKLGEWYFLEIRINK